MSFLKVRERLEEDPAFAAVTVESERIRLFNEHVGSLEVVISRQVGLSYSFIYLEWWEKYPIDTQLAHYSSHKPDLYI